jgi:hypothetical protein
MKTIDRQLSFRLDCISSALTETRTHVVRCKVYLICAAFPDGRRASGKKMLLPNYTPIAPIPRSM